MRAESMFTSDSTSLPLDAKEEFAYILTVFHKTLCHKFHIMVYKIGLILLEYRVHFWEHKS